MRARALERRPKARSAAAPTLQWPSVAALMFLRGRAPDGLVYQLGIGRFGSGEVKL